MVIAFNQTPSGTRVPFTHVEFDSSKAAQGPSVQPFKGLLIGLRETSGSVDENIRKRITSADQAADFWGVGSIAHNMAVAWFANNQRTELWGIAVNEAGVAASGTITVSGTATAAGTLSIYVAGRRIQVTVASGDSASTVAAAIDTEVNALEGAPMTSGVAAAVVTLTAVAQGEQGNSLDVRTNYYEGEEDVPGISLAIVQPSGGSGTADISSVFAPLADEQYNVIACGVAATGQLNDLDTELADRWGPVRANDGVAICAKDDTHANLLTFGDGRNSKHTVLLGYDNGPTPPWEVAAAVAAIVADQGAIDPARPFQTLPIRGVLPPSGADVFTHSERDLLLHDGIATMTVDAQGQPRVDRLITTYQENDAGFADTAFLDLNTLLTLSYLRYDWRTFWSTKYARHKLAEDGVQISEGQAIMTPALARAEAIGRFRAWEDLGLVEGVDQFKRDLIVEPNDQDPNRLDMLLPPDLINQLRVTGVQIAFRL